MENTLPVREYDQTINSEIERLLYQNSVILMDAKGLTTGVDDAAFNRTTHEGRWSVGQCFAHVNTTHGLWRPLIEKAVEDGQKRKVLSDGPYAYGFLSRMFLRMSEPPVGFRLKAPKTLQPAASVSVKEVMDEFEEHHERLERLLNQANGLDLARLRVSTAFSKRLRLSLGMTFWIMMAHDRRHIWQARQLRQSPEWTASSAQESPSES